ncbi:Vesicle membrane protein (v-SNARE) [Komagataella phaffii CBS 7435]|uniref:Synaptobrevin homolog YKT6 n=2 Tax=Komagataella phaffii TaxID=460519 RepID=C4QZ63_KOMPG|nr:Synaptobrevin homolog YKT6 [Komagataella phaffii GS115]AOA61572.1 GQ67_01461T0 [Komagataella phaffii]CAH2447365.1 Vesicle membrane protein (v-SNARE) [Komagataella phaffii CBS 7435]AOA65876.1 GQ68_01477T0 [Komagataella phaffii GS115]CAY68537.1 Synaptobrevin homolog YKT6 [Komagataella phaffii GS115]CCA37598.1 Vesicle membrane protein (v-SNARE) [Komagataella phaffii CBS 7435]
MKLYYLGVIKTNSEKAVELSHAKDLSQFSFFEKNGVSQFMTFFAETVAKRTPAGQRQSVEEGNYIGHVYSRSEGIACVLITDKEYPVRPAYTLLNKVADEYLAVHPPSQWESVTVTTPSLAYPELEQYLRTYQDPSQADSLSRVQKELDETKIVLHKTIESVLQRGEKLDSLVDKSEALSSSSRMFYKQAKKTNSCCLIM